MNERLATFRDRIERFSAARRGVANATLAYRLGTVAAVALIAALILLSGWLPNAVVNVLLFITLAGLLIGLAAAYVMKRLRFPGYLNEAFIMEELVGGLNSRLISALDFLNTEIRSPLTDAVIEQAAGDLDRVEFEQQIDRLPHRRRRRQCIAAAVVLVVLGLTPWFGVGRLFGNLRDSWIAVRDLLFPVEYVLSPESGEYVHTLGETVEVALEFKQRGYDEVTLIDRTGEEEVAETLLDVTETGRAARLITSDVEARRELAFRFGKRETEPIVLVFTSRPSVVNMQTEIIYPGYTKLLPRTLEGIQQRLLALEGSRITLGFTFSKDLASASILWDTGEELPLETVGRFASIGLLHQRPRQARVQVRDVHGLELEYPLVIEFEMQNDERPRLFMPRHLGRDMAMLADGLEAFGFGIRAQDDYGVTRAVLKWQKVTVDNPNTVLDHGEIERLISPSQRQAVVSFEKTFATLALQPGDKVRFQVEAYDNRAPEKQLTKSRPCSLFIYQEELGGLSVAQLGFGRNTGLTGGRIPKSRRATSVKAPEGIRTRELVTNEFDADVVTETQAPAARGEYRDAVRDYFRLLSDVSYEDEDESEPTQGPMDQAPPAPPQQ